MSRFLTQQAYGTINRCLHSRHPHLSLDHQNLRSKDLINDTQLLDEFSRCTHIKFLSLTHNQLDDISFLSFLKDFTQLERLDLRGNKIADVSVLLPLITRSEKTMAINGIDPYPIFIDDNYLNNPGGEVLRQGNYAVIRFFEGVKFGYEYLYEAKMLIIGQPRAGKTTLRLKFFNINSEMPGEDQTTRGIDITRLSFPILDRENRERDFYYNVWDFGGQHIYQTTHQFFLTQRSLYVLVLDTGNDNLGNDDSNVNFWLQAIELLSNKSPMLILRNEKAGRFMNINIDEKRKRFPFIVKDYTVDLNALIQGRKSFDPVQAENFTRFKEDVQTELRRLPLVGTKMPLNWVKIREGLFELSKIRPYIYLHEYQTICEQHQLLDYDSQMDLSKTFHDLGVYLHFQDHGHLDDFIILQNVWATDAVFAALDNQTIKAQKGVFTSAEISQIWKEKNYDKETHKKLLSLMMLFELCYQVNDSTYIIPEMLSPQAPVDYQWENRGALPMSYRYDFMPKGILTKFIVRMHKHIARDNGVQEVWKTGVKLDGRLMDCPDTYAQITEAWNNKELFVSVRGKLQKELMTRIIYQMDAINDEFFKDQDGKLKLDSSNYYKMIPCICSNCAESNRKHFFDYNDLTERRSNRVLTVECKKPPEYHRVEIKKLIDEVMDEQSHAGTSDAINVFISYAHEDKDQKKSLVKYLAPIAAQKIVTVWVDDKLQEGYWDPQVEKALHTTDIYLLIITSNFLDSEYINKKELAVAYERLSAGKAKILPIIFEPCDWSIHPLTYKEIQMHPAHNIRLFPWLGQLQAIPQDGVPVSELPNKERGMLDIIEHIKKLAIAIKREKSGL